MAILTGLMPLEVLAVGALKSVFGASALESRGASARRLLGEQVSIANQKIDDRHGVYRKKNLLGQTIIKRRSERIVVASDEERVLVGVRLIYWVKV